MTRIQVGRTHVRRDTVTFKELDNGDAFLQCKGGDLVDKSLCFKVSSDQCMITNDHGTPDVNERQMKDTKFVIEDIRPDIQVERPEFVIISWR